MADQEDTRESSLCFLIWIGAEDNPGNGVVQTKNLQKRRETQVEKSEGWFVGSSIVRASNTRIFILFKTKSLVHFLLYTTKDEFLDRYWWSTLKQVVSMALSFAIMRTDIQIAFSEGFEAGFFNNPAF